MNQQSVSDSQSADELYSRVNAVRVQKSMSSKQSTDDFYDRVSPYRKTQEKVSATVPTQKIDNMAEKKPSSFGQALSYQMKSGGFGGLPALKPQEAKEVATEVATIAAIGMAFSPIYGAAAAAKYAPRVLTAITRLTHAATTGSAVRATGKLVTEGELPSKEELIENGLQWAAVDGILQALHVTSSAGKTVYDFGKSVDRLSTKYNVPKTQILSTLWTSAKNYIFNKSGRKIINPSDIKVPDVEVLIDQSKKAQKDGLGTIIEVKPVKPKIQQLSNQSNKIQQLSNQSKKKVVGMKDLSSTSTELRNLIRTAQEEQTIGKNERAIESLTRAEELARKESIENWSDYSDITESLNARKKYLRILPPDTSNKKAPEKPKQPPVIAPIEAKPVITEVSQPVVEKPKISTPVETKENTSLNLYHGSGRSEKESMYTHNAIPILGKGKYFAFDEDTASQYGSKVERINFVPKNPLIIKNDSDWKSVVKKVGWKFANPIFGEKGEVEKNISDLNSFIKENGYDSVIILFEDTKYDIDSNGNSIKTLKNVFGDPQVFIPENANKSVPISGYERKATPVTVQQKIDHLSKKIEENEAYIKNLNLKIINERHNRKEEDPKNKRQRGLGNYTLYINELLKHRNLELEYIRKLKLDLSDLKKNKEKSRVQVPLGAKYGRRENYDIA